MMCLRKTLVSKKGMGHGEEVFHDGNSGNFGGYDSVMR
jgi:hypothetical protein